MARDAGIFFCWAAAIIVIALCVGQNVRAQNISTPITQFNCSAASSITLNPVSINGTWFEVARKPLPTFDNTIVACAELKVEVAIKNATNSNTTLTLTTTFSNNLSAMWKNSTVVAQNITLDDNYMGSFNLSYNMPTPNVTIKVLATDYNSYAFVCGYVNASTNATAIILTRDRWANNTVITKLEKQAAVNYTDFQNLLRVPQSEQCLRSTSSAAETTVPALTTILAVIYSIFKALN